MQLFIIMLFSITWAMAQQTKPLGMKLDEIDKVVYCHPISMNVYEQKLREWYHIDLLEEELKDVVTSPASVEQRERIKSLKSSHYFADRLGRRDIEMKMKAEFDLMVIKSGRGQKLEHMPTTGASATLSGSEKGSLEIHAESIEPVEQELIDEVTRKKLSNHIKVRYNYPIDKFDYIFNLDGKELPFKDVVHKLQDSFEEDCYLSALKARDIRKHREGSSGGGGSSRR